MKELAISKQKNRVYVGKSASGARNCQRFKCLNVDEIAQKIVSVFPKESLSLKSLKQIVYKDAKYSLTQLKNLCNCKKNTKKGMTKTMEKTNTNFSPKPIIVSSVSSVISNPIVAKPVISETVIAKPVIFSRGFENINFIVSASLTNLVKKDLFHEHPLGACRLNDFYYVICFKNNRPKDVLIKKMESTKFNSLKEDFFAFNNFNEAKIFSETFFDRYFLVLENGKWKNINKKDIRKEILSNPSFFRQKKVVIFSSQEEKIEFLKEKAKEEDVVEIFVDGASNNKSQYAWAYVAFQGDNEIAFDKGHEENKKFAKHGAQVGEFLSMLHAIDYVIENRFHNVIVYYDNFKNFDCMQTLSTAKDSVLCSLYLKYYQEMLKKRELLVRMQSNITFLHSKAHSGIKGNERADYYAKKALKEIGCYFE